MEWWHLHSMMSELQSRWSLRRRRGCRLIDIGKLEAARAAVGLVRRRFLVDPLPADLLLYLDAAGVDWILARDPDDVFVALAAILLLHYMVAIQQLTLNVRHYLLMIQLFSITNVTFRLIDLQSSVVMWRSFYDFSFDIHLLLFCQ